MIERRLVVQRPNQRRTYDLGGGRFAECVAQDEHGPGSSSLRRHRDLCDEANPPLAPAMCDLHLSKSPWFCMAAVFVWWRVSNRCRSVIRPTNAAGDSTALSSKLFVNSAAKRAHERA